MVRILLHGCNGRMGQMISSIVKETEGVVISAGVDVFEGIKNDFPVYSSIKYVKDDTDVIIDFSNAKAVDDVLDYAEAKNIPVVLCTTGLSDTQLSRVEAASKKTAILRSANMSLGINLLIRALKELSPVLAEAGFDIEIVEKHHNKKLDAPSGTALALGEAIKSALPGEYEDVYDRSERRMARPKNEIGYSAVRGGTIVGDHDVIFAGTDEVITFSHRAYSRAVFAKGAVAAAKFLSGKTAGMYDMSDVIG
ncbi:MAG: 4-hydroxy-tetrahydrodipicolinate reductase [Lachnospiraceae bacterium]|nr:4-hydroxy-tetrahydrodipicolinate reductase [Lachnospiraceae bacterium]